MFHAAMTQYFLVFVLIFGVFEQRLISFIFPFPFQIKPPFHFIDEAIKHRQIYERKTTGDAEPESIFN